MRRVVMMMRVVVRCRWWGETELRAAMSALM